MKKIISVLLVLCLCLSSCWVISYAECADISGQLTEVPDGYIGIYSKNDLNNIRTDLNGKYILMRNIYFGDYDFEDGGIFYNDGVGWVPIGMEKNGNNFSYYHEFKGVFDGNGYSVYNIKSRITTSPYSSYDNDSYPDTHSIGLFAYNKGNICNLSIESDYSVKSNDWALVGGICGINGGSITNCHTSGKMFLEKTGDCDDCFIGGIAGFNNGGTIYLCSNGINIGGVNSNDFTYLNCGGIIGGTSGKGNNTISCCYNTGNINPKSVSEGYLGGIAGRVAGVGIYDGFSITIENCYNAGIIGDNNACGKIAGISGEHNKYTTLSNCYNVGYVLSSKKSSGIVSVGNNPDTSTCYYLNNSADYSYSNYFYPDKYTNVNDLYDSQMKTEEAFISFDFENVWIVDANADYSYPQLINNIQSKTELERHSYSKNIAKEATCTENGINKYTCVNCGFVLDVAINAKGHSYDSSVVTDPTCTAKGYTTYTCECGDSYVDDYTAALGHSPATAVVENEVAATCTSDGSYDEVEYCTECSTELSREAKTIDKLGHSLTNYVSNDDTTCTQDGTKTAKCDRCDVTDTVTNQGSKLDHDESVWIIDKAPDCTETGRKHTKCVVCGKIIQTEIIPAIGHKYIQETIEPTCEEEGSIIRICTACKEENLIKVLPETGHTDADNDGKCDSCSKEMTGNCSCICHKSGFMGFIWKIINFFNKLFKTNKICACGVAHY